MSNVILTYDQFVDTMLNEAAVTFGGKAYPKYDNILVLAGGAGSGKGFALNNAIAFDGKHLDVDEIKNEVLKLGDDSSFGKRFYKDKGKKLSELDLKNPDDVSELHLWVDKSGTAVEINNAFFKSQKDAKVKSNVIFDVTLSYYPHYDDILQLALIGGYKPENIHICWVLNDVSVAIEQNTKRDRTVSQEVLSNTHKGVAKFFKNMLAITRRHFDAIGDVWILFVNKNENDNDIKLSNKGGKYLEHINSVKIKEQGKPLPEYDTVMNMDVKVYDTKTNKVTGHEKLRDKINRYIPDECDKF